MEKSIDLKQPVYFLCKEYPELMEILASLGFKDITKPGMLNTMGKFMTLDKGAKMKDISMEEIEDRLLKEGFIIRKE